MCLLYGREGYHARFLRPLARSLGCEYREAEYLQLYSAFRSGRPGIYYIEEPWAYEREAEAPEPPWRLPRALEALRGRMLPLLGNVQVLYTRGLLRRAAGGPCGRVGLLAKPGEPLLTDLLLPLYLELGDLKAALEEARRLYSCGLPASRDDMLSGAHSVGYIWLAWALNMDAELLPNPALGGPLSGIWGLAWVGLRPTELTAYAHPPPYLDVPWPEHGRHRRLLELARPVRGKGWMPLVERAWKPLHAYLTGRATASDAMRALDGLPTALQP